MFQVFNASFSNNPILALGYVPVCERNGEVDVIGELEQSTSMTFPSACCRCESADEPVLSYAYGPVKSTCSTQIHF